MNYLLCNAQPVCKSLLKNFTLLRWVELSLVCKATWNFFQSESCYRFYQPTATSPLDAILTTAGVLAVDEHVRCIDPVSLITRAITLNNVVELSPVADSIVYCIGLLTAYTTNRMDKIRHWRVTPALYLLEGKHSERARYRYKSATGFDYYHTAFNAVHCVTADSSVIYLPPFITSEDRIMTTLAILGSPLLSNSTMLSNMISAGLTTYCQVFALAIVSDDVRLNNFFAATRSLPINIQLAFRSSEVAQAWSTINPYRRREVANICKQYLTPQFFINTALPHQTARYFNEYCDTEEQLAIVIGCLTTNVVSSDIALTILKRATQHPRLAYIKLAQFFLAHYEEEVMGLVEALGKMSILELPTLQGSDHYTAYSKYYNSRGYHPRLFQLTMLAPCVLLNTRPPLCTYTTVKDPLNEAYKCWRDGKLREARDHGYAAMYGVSTKYNPYAR